MSRLARLAVRKPVRVLVSWLLFVIVLGAIGHGVEGKLKPAKLLVPGTEANRWNDLRKGHFGEDATVLLTGPPSAIERQGPPLARALAARPNTHALSPWSGHGASRLRPRPEKALIVMDLAVPPGQTASSVVPPVERFVERRISPPVVPHFAGLTPLGKDINDATVKSIRTAEMIAYPVLLIVLLIVFRSPVAAAIPLAIAVGTLQSGFGVISIITDFASLDSIALSIASMIGLALGVDYSLLIVTRFREALEEGLRPAAAATLAANTAGRTAVFAGVVLIAIQLVTFFLSPGTILLSAAVGAIVVTALSMVGATLITPAAVCLLGERVNKWSIGRSRREATAQRSFIGQAVGRFSRRPALTTLIALALLLALAAPVLGINTIPPDPRQLPKDSRGLQDFLQIRKAGFGPTAEVALKVPSGSLTYPDRLRAIDRFERRVARLPYVKLVVGPGLLGEQTAALQRAPQDIKNGKRQLVRAARDLGTLASGLAQATSGVRQLRSGLVAAANGSQQLVAGTGQAITAATNWSRAEHGPSRARVPSRTASRAREPARTRSRAAPQARNPAPRAWSPASASSNWACRISWHPERARLRSSSAPEAFSSRLCSRPPSSRRRSWATPFRRSRR